jgi:hypothetical protein
MTNVGFFGEYMAIPCDPSTHWVHGEFDDDGGIAHEWVGTLPVTVAELDRYLKRYYS